MDLEKLKVLAQAATPGPWSRDTNSGLSGDVFAKQHPSYLASPRGYPVCLTWGLWHSQKSPEAEKRKQKEANRNADYIAAASPDVVLSLISEIEELRAHAEALANSLSYLRALPGIPLQAFEESGRVLWPYITSEYHTKKVVK